MGKQQTELTKTKKSLSLALNVRLKPCTPLVADVAAVQVQRPQRGGARHARLRATRQRFELYVAAPVPRGRFTGRNCLCRCRIAPRLDLNRGRRHTWQQYARSAPPRRRSPCRCSPPPAATAAPALPPAHATGQQSSNSAANSRAVL